MTFRNRELLYLVMAGLAVAIAYASVFIAQAQVVTADSLVYGGFFLALLLVAHLGVRMFAPLADPYLLPATGLLAGLGVTMIYRLRPDLAGRQSLWLVVGVAVMLLVLRFLSDHRVLERYKYLIGATGVLALIVTVSPLGTEVRGAQLWLQLGPVQIQPGEFAKVGIVVFLAAYLRENRELLSMRFSPKHLGPLLLFWGAALALLVLMNDFGTSLLFYGSFLMMVFVATGRLWYVAGGLAAFLAGSFAVLQVAPHVQRRFDIWLDPWQDPQGAGFQLVQGLFALADGGVFGRGLGQAYLVTGEERTLIPDAHTDFIFAALANELGLFGAVGLLLLYVVFMWRGLAIAAATTDGFSKLLAFGLTATLGLQTIVIVGGIVRLMPLTGLTLPFVSYGGSSIVANFIILGLLLVMSNRMRLLAAQQQVAAAPPASRSQRPAGAGVR